MTDVPRERLLLAMIMLGGAVLRFWAFGGLALSHFDEGVYAFAGLWVLKPGGLAALDPGVIPYAPGGFPLLVGAAYSLVGVSDSAAVLPATLLGVAAVPAAWWIGKRTFGGGAGLVSAAFAAFSLVAIAFSRKALTDMPFLVCWLLAMGTAGRFLERPSWGRAMWLGGAVGLAQYFKYNGWLAGAVVLVAAIAGWIADPGERRRGTVVRTLGFGLLAALVAAAIYAPWFLFVERHGGYAALLRHHRSYAGGLANWLPHWNAQLAQAHALSGAPVLPLVAWGTAWSLAWWAARDRLDTRLIVVGLLAGGPLLSALTNLPWWIGLAAAPWLLRSPRPAERVLGSWWLVLSVLTPFYHPYARLWLPLHGAGWILLSGLAVNLAARRTPEATDRRAVNRWTAVAVAVTIAAAAQAAAVRAHALPAAWVLRPAPSLRDAAVALAPATGGTSERPTLVVLARRPLAFYLSLLHQTVRLADGLPALRHPPAPATQAIVDEALLIQEADARTALTELERYWVAETRFADALDPVTLLDVHPGAAYQARPKRTYSLWRLAPRGDSSGAPTH